MSKLNLEAVLRTPVMMMMMMMMIIIIMKHLYSAIESEDADVAAQVD